MPRTPKQEKPGRPIEYKDVERKSITFQLPVELIKYIDSITQNRTKWLTEAVEEKQSRELRGK